MQLFRGSGDNGRSANRGRAPHATKREHVVADAENAAVRRLARRRCRDREMSHGKPLKATARNRLKATYAVMRDRVPYTV